MSGALENVTIKGFKSIKSLEHFELNNLNVIIGANGAGKSNFISFFKLFSALIEGRVNRFVRDHGGANDLLFCGPKATSKIEFAAHFGAYSYRFNLVATPGNDVAIEDEALKYSDEQSPWTLLGDSGNGMPKLVSELKNGLAATACAKPLHDAFASWKVYHFHDTSSTAPMRGEEIVQDNKFLRWDAANIGAFLLKLKHEYQPAYQDIVNAIQLVAPFFDEFVLEPYRRGSKEVVNLSWRQKGSDYPMQPYHFSDGSIRFICLATSLLQPNPPATMVIDEPELGLHPAAIAILAELIKAASDRTQVVVATQSPELINYFSIDDIIVASRTEGASTFSRLRQADYQEWLEDYSVGELWNKNIIAGSPVNE